MVDPGFRAFIPSKKKFLDGNKWNDRRVFIEEWINFCDFGAVVLQDKSRLTLYDRTVMPHLKASYNLARWLTRNDQDAEDVMQEAFVRAFRSLEGFRGGDSRAWVLAIVRNTSYTWLKRNRKREYELPFDDLIYDIAEEDKNPETVIMKRLDKQALTQALEELPVEFREVLVLREIEELSYKEIAQIADLPLGTVMSRIARARQRLLRSLSVRMDKELRNEL